MKKNFAKMVALAALTVAIPSHAKVQRPPQFVLLAFDGSQSYSMWQNTTAFAKQESIAFTYFISGVYFLRKGDGYTSPRGVGKSDIGFGKSAEDIAGRNTLVLNALNSGNEMASHANGHFDGAGWSAQQWLTEMTQFHNILIRSVEQFGGVRDVKKWRSIWSPGTGAVVGFRAPLLAKNDGMYSALARLGYQYDTSRVDKMSYWPTVKNGLWDFPLAGLRMARSGKKTLSMDYNLYVAQSGGQKGPESLFGDFENEAYETYMNYFANNFYGNRAPMHIGHHFSLWNGGAYWKAMQRVAQTVCHLPEVRCVTYKELLDFVNANASLLPAYQRGDFEQVTEKHIPLAIRASATTELSDAEIQSLQKQVCPASAHNEEELESAPEGVYL